MSSPAASGRVYRFGVFEVDLGKRELSRRGAQVRIQDQPFHVLCMLLEQPGGIVTREQLRQALWPSDTYVEFDGSLNAALKRLRFALGDSARNPTFIETLPKLGYRFIAPVSAGDLPVVTTQPATRPAGGNGYVHALVKPKVAVQPRGRWMYWAAPCAAAVLLHQIVYWLFPLPPPRMINRTRLTHIGNVNPGPIVSDGTHIFFCARRGAKYFPMQTSVGGGDAVELKTPFKNSVIFDISRDRSSFLLGSSERGGDPSRLWIWPADGGAPRSFGDFLCVDAVWSPDGRRVAYTTHTALYVANPDGSAPRMLAGKEGYAIAWSADNSKLRFSTWDPASNTHSLWEVGADGTGLRQVFPDEKSADVSSGFWLAGGKYFAFLRWSASGPKLWMRRERPSFWRRSSSVPVLVPTGSEDTETIAGLGGNGSTMISVGYWPETRLQRLSWDAHSLTPVAAFPLAGNLHFSRDGKWVAYTSRVNGSLWRCRAGGGDCLQLTPAPAMALEPRWSPDGTQILFTEVHSNAIRRLYVVAANGSSAPRTLGPADLVADVAEWSPDGKQIVLDMSAAAPGAPDYLYLVDAATGKADLLPGPEGLHSPAWSRDGRLISAVSSSASEIHLYDVALKKWLPGPTGTRLTYQYWSNNSSSLFYQDSGEAGQPVYRLNPQSGKRELVFSFDEVLQKDAMTCRLAGIGVDDTLYAYTIGATADLFEVDLDLP
jgi:DNA-binding winged helix-turn-helix (wHTH) protein/Tol biopolymer transport system component